MTDRDHAAGAKPETQIDNPRVRVTRWTFAKKGDATGWHIHEHDYVVVPLFDGVLEIDTGEEIVQAPMQTGVSYFRQKGVAHNLINANDFPCAFVEIELLEPAP